MFAYLRKRGIASQVIQRFLDAGLLYEDAPYHNCVFVGRDGSGQAVFFTDAETVVSADDNHILVDNDWGIAAVFQDIALQRRKLLSAERREQLFYLRQDESASVQNCCM
ncbi:DUF3991 domain-containing protein [Oscillospiraceae bacterium 38-13]